MNVDCENPECLSESAYLEHYDGETGTSHYECPNCDHKWSVKS